MLTDYVVTDKPLSGSSVKCWADNCANVNTARKMANVTNTKQITEDVLKCIADCASKCNQVLPVKKYCYIICTLEDAKRNNSQKELENVIKACEKHIVCFDADATKMAAAECVALANICYDIDAGEFINPDGNKVMKELVNCFKKYGIRFQLVHSIGTGSIGTGLSGGFNPKNPDTIDKLMMVTIAKANGSLGTRFPVELTMATSPFPWGTGTGGKDIISGLGADAPPSAGDKALDALISAIPGVIAKGTDLLKEYGEAKLGLVKQDFNNKMADLVAQDTGTSAGNVTQEQINAYAQQHQAEAQAALQAAAAAHDVDLKKQMQDQQNKTLMYIGIGAGVLLLFGMGAIVITRSK